MKRVKTDEPPATKVIIALFVAACLTCNFSNVDIASLQKVSG